jgi:hypothetical protein
MMQNRPMASLSFDLDNLWSYLRTHGDPGWEAYPSYLDVVLPRMLSVVRKVGLHMTVFVVGKDAETEQHRSLLQRIPKEGHEVGNHSLHHLQWLHKLPHAELRREIVESDRLIHEATGCKPRGFRGPGFACSESLLRILAENGYDYDGSTFPTFLGPIARAYYFFSSRRFSAKEADERKDLFGGVSDGLRPLSLYCWALDSQHHGNPTTDLVEIPVTTMPLLRAPFHMSYLLFLAQKSPFLMRRYVELALSLCVRLRIEPSFLLHPLDVVSEAECPELRFFPAMSLPSHKKEDLVVEVLSMLAERFCVVTMGEHARTALERGLPRRRPDFGT